MANSTSPPQTTRESTEQQQQALATLVPPVDIFETDTGFILLADMPGVSTEGLEVLVERDALLIRGRMRQPEREADYQEFEYGEYRRTFLVTEDLDTQGINATLRDGVLRVDIPKSPRLQPKKIPVRAE